MPVLLGLIAAAGAIIFFMMRARNAAATAHDVADMAGDLVSAARRFGFRRRYNEHPVDSISDPILAQGALAIAISATGPAQTAETRVAQTTALRKHLQLDAAGAEEILAMGQWFINECGGPDPAVTRLAKKVFKLSGAAAIHPVASILSDTARVAGQLSEREKEALAEASRLIQRR